MKNIKILTFKRIHGSLMFTIVNFKTKETYTLYFQTSFMKPWWLPKYDPNFTSKNIPLYGWLFFYFGRLTEGLIFPTDEVDCKIKDSDGNGYHLYTFTERSLKDEVRHLIKQGNVTFKYDNIKNAIIAIEN